MSIPTDFTQTIKKIQTASANEVQQAKALLSQSRKADVNKYVQALSICILNPENDAAIRIYAIDRLRSVTSDIQNGWPDISKDNRALIKVKLFDLLEKEQSKEIQARIVRTIAHLYENIYTLDDSILQTIGEDEGKWDEVLEKCLDYINPDKELLIHPALDIISRTVEANAMDFEENIQNILKVIERVIKGSNSRNIAMAVTAYGSLDEHLDSGILKINTFIPLILKALKEKFGKEKEEEEVYFAQAIYDLFNQASSNQKMAKQYYKELIELATIHSQGRKFDTLFNGYIGISKLIESFPKLAQKNANLLPQILVLGMEVSSHLFLEVEDKWKEEKTEIADKRIALAASVACDIAKGIGMSTYLKQMIALHGTIQKQKGSNNQNFKQILAPLHMIGLAGEACEIEEEVKQIFNILLEALFNNSNNPFVQAHILGLIDSSICELEQKFTKFGKLQVLEPILKFGDSIQIPGLFYQWQALVCTLLEHLKPQDFDVSKYELSLINIATQWLQCEKPWIMKETLKLISSISKFYGIRLRKYWTGLADLAYRVLTLSKEQKEYEPLSGPAICCLTAIGKAVRRKTFNEVSDKIIQAILEAHDYEASESEENQLLMHICTAWQQLIQTFNPDEISKYFEKGFDFLLDVFGEVTETAIKSCRQQIIVIEEGKEGLEEEEKTDKIEPHFSVNILNADKFVEEQNNEFKGLENCTQIMEFIQETLEKMYSHYGGKIDRFGEIFRKGIEANNKVSYIFAENLFLLGKILNKASQEDKELVQKKQEMMTKFVEVLLAEANSNFDVEKVEIYTQAVSDIMKHSGELYTTQEKFNEGFRQPMEEIWEGSKARYDQIQEKIDAFKGEDNEEDEEGEDELEIDPQLEKQIENEDAVQFSYAEAMLNAVKSHSAEIIKDHVQNLLATVFEEFSEKEDKTIATMIITMLFEFAPLESFGDRAKEFIEFLIKYSSGSGDYFGTMQNACFGLSLIAKKMSHDEFKPYFEKVYVKLKTAQNVPREDHVDEAQYNAFLDNIIACYGRIIRYQQPNIKDLNEFVSNWLRLMPLKEDTEEGPDAYELLADLILENAPLIFGEKGEHLKRNMGMLFDVLKTKFSSEGVEKKVKQIVEHMKKDDVGKTMLEQCVNGLEVNVKENLEEVLEN